jgi:2-polyprenyl-3-methyl-5-hydroxy-6-metoxy-1,4-benzoquinol methylase
MIVSPSAQPAGTGSGISWDEPACLLCGSDRRWPFVEAPDTSAGSRGLRFIVVQCEDCGLCYTCPRPDRQSIGQFYPADYRPHRAKRDTRYETRDTGKKTSRVSCLVSRVSSTATWSWITKLRGRPCVERRALPWHGQGRLLDFGCGGGSFLERMRHQGWQVTGLDVSEATVERIRSELGIRALSGTLPHAELEPGSFDVVTMWHSLEHVHDPLGVLRAAYHLLAPGGRLMVAVPNIDSAAFHWFGPAWFALELPRHLTHFAPSTLRAMLEAAGFRVERLRQIRHSDWLLSSAKLAIRIGRPTFWQRQLARKPIARTVAWACYAAGQSDCMMATAAKK